MSWVRRSRPGETYHAVGWMKRSAKSGVFLRLPLPGGDVVRVMEKGLHVVALEHAGRRLLELYRKSGKRWPNQ